MITYSQKVKKNWTLLIVVFPGLLIIIQNFDFLPVFAFSAPFWFIPMIMIIFACLALLLSVFQNQGIAPWTFPAIGGTVWGLWQLIMLWQFRASILLFDTLLLLLSIIGLAILVKFKWILTSDVWIQFLIIAIGISILELFRTSDLLDIRNSIYIQVLLWATYLIPALAFGLLLGRRFDFGTLLFVITLEPVWFLRCLGGNISFEVWTSTIPVVQIAKLIFQGIPYLIYLIVLPIILLSSKSLRNLWTVNIISIIAICSVTTAQVYFLVDPDVPVSFSLVPWAMWLQFVIVLYSPIFLSTLLSKNILAPK